MKKAFIYLCIMGVIVHCFTACTDNSISAPESFSDVKDTISESFSNEITTEAVESPTVKENNDEDNNANTEGTYGISTNESQSVTSQEITESEAVSEITEAHKPVETSVSTETSAEVIKNLVPVLTVKNIDSETNSLSWTEVEGAKLYILYLLNNETGEFEEYGEIKGTSCKDKKLIPNTKYTYAVAAVFSDESYGKMSEKVSIYTYSTWREPTQGNWIYYSVYEGETKTLIYRIKRDGSDKQLVCEYPGNVYFEGATDKYLYFFKSESAYDSDDYEYLQYSVIRTDLNGKNEKEMYVSTENYSIIEHEVYKDMLFYSYYGASMETDPGRYDLNVYDSNRDIAEGYDDIYDGMYHGISFVRDKNDVLYIMWLEEEIDYEATDNSEYGDIVTKKTGRIVLFNADTKEKSYVNYIDDGSFDSAYFLAYIDGKIYLRTGEGAIGYVSENELFTPINIGENTIHEAADNRNGDIFYEMYTFENGLIVKNELFRLSGEKSTKLVDLYFDNSGYVGQCYSLYGNYMIYVNPDGKSVYYDLTTREQIVLD